MKLIINNAEFDTTDLTPDQRKQLKAELDNLETGSILVPSIGNRYYFIDDFGKIRIKHWNGSSKDKYRLSQYNVFETKEKATRHVEYLEAVAVIREDAEWYQYNSYGENWCARWSPLDDLYADLNVAYVVPGVTYFETREKLEESFKNHRKEWLIYCGVNDG